MSADPLFASYEAEIRALRQQVADLTARLGRERSENRGLHDALRKESAQVADLTAQRDALRDAADIYVRMPTTKTLTDLRALIAQMESETTT